MAPTPNRPSVSNDDLVLYADVGLAFAVFFFALLGFPRLVARLTLPHCEGWFIRRAKLSDRFVATKIALDDSKPTKSDEENTSESEIAPYKIDLRDTPKSASVAPKLPMHIPSYTTLLSPVSKLASARYDGYSVGQYTVLMVYLGAIIVAMFLFSSPVNNITRAGFVCISQAPVVVLLGVKNGPIGALLGKGYEKLNYIHRWVGQLMFLAALFHVVGYLVKWTKTGTIAIASKNQAWGWFAFGGLVLLAMLSLPPIRRSSYAIFWHAHWIGFFMFTVASCYHVPACVPYGIAGLAIYTFDQLVRVLKSHVTTATITPVPALKCTQLSVPHLTRGWRAGQHVRVRVLNSGVGMLGWAETHPFTIASISAPDGNGDGLTLLCKRAGDWTENLYKMSLPSSAASEKAGAPGVGAGARVHVVIEGPYGGPSSAIPTSFTSALVVCGGSGITFGTSSIEEMVVGAETGCSRVRRCELVWVVQEHTAIAPLLPAFATLLARAADAKTLQLSITVHYTRASPDETISNLPVGVRIVAGRPNLKSALGNIVTRTEAMVDYFEANGGDDKSGKVTGVFVGVCGPSGLVENAWEAASCVDDKIKRRIGGIEVHEEAFGW
ncbi:Ferric reductase like transmembrane component [Ceratobasidium sp. AG-Ba]|nr:Ferric reductase like transmembrane component [Ceratobasidium sp. AG-Ba]